MHTFGNGKIEDGIAKVKYQKTKILVIKISLRDSTSEKKNDLNCSTKRGFHHGEKKISGGGAGISIFYTLSTLKISKDQAKRSTSQKALKSEKNLVSPPEDTMNYDRDQKIGMMSKRGLNQKVYHKRGK